MDVYHFLFQDAVSTNRSAIKLDQSSKLWNLNKKKINFKTHINGFSLYLLDIAVCIVNHKRFPLSIFYVVHFFSNIVSKYIVLLEYPIGLSRNFAKKQQIPYRPVCSPYTDKWYLNLRGCLQFLWSAFKPHRLKCHKPPSAMNSSFFSIDLDANNFPIQLDMISPL